MTLNYRVFSRSASKKEPRFDPDMSLEGSELISLCETGNSDLKALENDSRTGKNEPVDYFKQFQEKNRLHTTALPPNRESRPSVISLAKRLRRLVFKNGEVNVRKSNIRKRRRRFLADIFTTMVDLKWRYSLVVFIFVFVASWLTFAGIWYAIGKFHGDFDSDHIGNSAWKPCVQQVHNFTTALLFSIESQQTIGYGTRAISDECAEGILVLMIQSCLGVIIQALMTGIVFAKLSRAKKRAETLMFSKNMVISLRDGKLCLVIRVGDMRRSHLIEAHCRALLIQNRVTKEGEVLPLCQFDLDIGFDEGLDRVFMAWPVLISHEINEESPLWDISKEALMSQRFEVIWTLEGIIESTGMTTQARTSYMPLEILWGHRFRKLMQYAKEDGSYWIDYSRFHDTVPVETPTCSAKALKERQSGNLDRTLSNGSSSDDDSIDQMGRNSRPTLVRNKCSASFKQPRRMTDGSLLKVERTNPTRRSWNTLIRVEDYEEGL